MNESMCNECSNKGYNRNDSNKLKDTLSLDN